MVTHAVGESTRPEGAHTPARRPFWSRMSVGRIVMILAGLTAFVLNVNLLRSGEDPSLVAVAAVPIDAGTQITGEMLRFVELDASAAVLSRMIDDPADVGGLVASVDIPSGEPISLSLLRDSAASGGLRALSIPVDPAHAAGGDLITAGDVVDVIAVDEGTAHYVVSGVSVIDVASLGERGLVASSDYYVVVAVDADQALALAEALRADSVEVVRATGAPGPARSSLRAPSPAALGDGTGS